MLGRFLSPDTEKERILRKGQQKAALPFVSGGLARVCKGPGVPLLAGGQWGLLLSLGGAGGWGGALKLVGGIVETGHWGPLGPVMLWVGSIVGAVRH